MTMNVKVTVKGRECHLSQGPGGRWFVKDGQRQIGDQEVLYRNGEWHYADAEDDGWLWLSERAAGLFLDSVRDQDPAPRECPTCGGSGRLEMLEHCPNCRRASNAPADEPGEARWFRKKAVTIQAIQWTGQNEDAVKAFCPECQGPFEDTLRTGHAKPYLYFRIATLEGAMRADMGDWIVRGVKGEFYPCKPDIFEATNEPVSSAAPVAPQSEAELPTDVGLWLHPTGWADIGRKTAIGSSGRLSAEAWKLCGKRNATLGWWDVDDCEFPRGGWRPAGEKSVTPPTEIVGGQSCSEKCSDTVRAESTATRSARSSTGETDTNYSNAATGSGCEAISSGQPTPSVGAADSAEASSPSNHSSRDAIGQGRPAGVAVGERSASAEQGLPFGLRALPIAIAGHVSQPNRLYIEVTDDVRQRLATARVEIARLEMLEHCPNCRRASNAPADEQWEEASDRPKDIPPHCREQVAAYAVHCSRCGKAVSSPIMHAIVVRAFVECPECIAKTPADEPGEASDNSLAKITGCEAAVSYVDGYKDGRTDSLAMESELTTARDTLATLVEVLRCELLCIINSAPVHARDDHSQNCGYCRLLKMIDDAALAAPAAEGAGE